MKVFQISAMMNNP